ncbi:VUT family protein [Micromonospora sp. NPDC050980]|uniref:VUT family protein n=1 Tax=Micromonospora sp. NPDC050980 TaxID=3155161 RepID=UPI0033F25F98
MSPLISAISTHHPLTRRALAAVAAIVAFVATIVTANLLTARYGLVPVGFGLTATAGTASAGLTLLLRDAVHQIAGRIVTLLCIAAGAALCAGLASARLALASACAFLISEMTDLLVYERLRAHRGWMWAALASNCIGAPVDSALFLALAGLPIWAAMPGQVWVKTVACAISLAAVAVSRALLRHRLRPPCP